MKQSHGKKKATRSGNTAETEAGIQPATSGRLKTWTFRLLLAVGVPLGLLGMVELVYDWVVTAIRPATSYRPNVVGCRCWSKTTNFAGVFSGQPWRDCPSPFAFPARKAPTRCE